MRLLNQRIVFITLFLCVQLSHAVVLSSSDTLRIFMLGTTGGKDKEPLGFKITKHSDINYSAYRQLTAQSHIYIKTNGNKDFFIPFLEEGWMRWRKNGFTATGGLFKSRYGRTKFYKSISVYNPMFENYVLWDAYGIGIAVEKEKGRSFIKGAVTMDQEKSSAAHLLYRVKYKRFTGVFLSGIQLSPSEIQNDRFTIGSEMFLNYHLIKLHTVIAYDYIKHFGIPANTTANKMANIICSFIEARIRASKFLDINLLTYYKNYQRNDDYKSIYSGYIIESIIKRWFGIGYGFEAELRNNELTTVPEIFLLFRPIKEHVSLKLGFKIGKEDELSWPYRWSANVRIEF